MLNYVHTAHVFEGMNRAFVVAEYGTDALDDAALLANLDVADFELDYDSRPFVLTE